ncbi:hypothetical protein HRG_010953 [Hirsutella rhossiliensis]|uniref:Uncharacterized protein n=1 Tax=Hirsutella rhossiliensis TaxID=111463 RepID=A0A9P8SDZ6_9HYPO|nr:uncharacterized protein HRG_10953 [Hirsutella rhossiliensis]KAH0957860.1 hypothetical protein HRG_10953 [Hirsutella rhossiliensis]
MSAREPETSPAAAAADSNVAAPTASIAAAAAASASATTLTSAKQSSVQTQDQDGLPPADESNPPPPPFEPLFTLLTNTTTNGTIHPRVQYLFSDDDTSVLADPPPPAIAGPDGHAHRPVLVDLAPSPDGSSWTVAWASSLSPDFALTTSRLEPAPQQQHEADASSSAAPGGVLRLEGVEREPVDARPESLPGSASGSGTVGREDVDALADEFRRRMGVLRKVVGEAERRKEVVQRHHHHQPHQPDGAESRSAEPDGSTQDGEAGPVVEAK